MTRVVSLLILLTTLGGCIALDSVRPHPDRMTREHFEWRW